MTPRVMAVSASQEPEQARGGGSSARGMLELFHDDYPVERFSRDCAAVLQGCEIGRGAEI